jgi:hypothetical protein
MIDDETADKLRALLGDLQAACATRAACPKRLRKN